MSKTSHSSHEPLFRPMFRAGGRGSSRIARVALLLILASSFVAGSSLLVAGDAFAQTNQYSFSKNNQKKMLKVIEFLQVQGTEAEVAAAQASAREVLDGINLKRAKPYGRARIHQLLGTLDAQDEKFESALNHLEASIAEDALQPEVQLSTLYLVGQLQTMLERYDAAVETLEKWIAQVEAPAPSNYYTLAVTYYQAGRPDDAMPAAKKAIELSTDTPREAWYRLLLSLHLEKSEYQEALAILDDVILAYPKKAYWSQMAAIYSAIEKGDKSLAVQLLAKYEGFITEDRDMTRIAQMYMVEGLPHRGADVMKEGLAKGIIEPTKQAYQTYSDTLLQSREWELALEPLSKAAEMDKDGALFIRLAQVNIQLMRWGDARDSINRALAKGGLSDEGQAHLLFGIAAANDRKWSAATAAFDRAARFKGTAVIAEKWKDHVLREKARFGDN